MRMLIANRYYQRYADGEEYSFKVLLDVQSGSWLALNPDTGEYTDRYVTPEGHRRGVDAPSDPDRGVHAARGGSMSSRRARP